jgi:transaldolase
MIGCTLKTFGVPAVRGDEAYVNRAIDTPISLDDYRALKDIVKFVGVTDEFKNVIETFNTPEGETPAGFRREYKLAADGVLLIDLVRDISYDKNGELRPTKVLFSADSANPYEVAPISPLLANLTCNPGIVYDLFINNPKANVGGLYKTRDEVMAEIGRVLGPGCDISVELNNPFEKDFNLILEEAAKFKEMFSKYRVVIKVPHTGAVTPENVHQLLDGDKKLANDYTDVQTAEALRGHNLCLKLTEAGYRVNFTLMFEPYQTQMALQARPYFINTFLRHRLVQSTNIKKFVDAYEATGDKKQLEALKAYLYSVDYFAPGTVEKVSLDDVYTLAKDTIRYRKFETAEGSDGLDGMRHNLRVLRNCNMPDTRLIVCSMEGPNNYPDIDKLLAEPEFMDMHHKVVITAEPNYLARFTSTNQVTSYQRRFMNAAKGQK